MQQSFFFKLFLYTVWKSSISFSIHFQFFPSCAGAPCNRKDYFLLFFSLPEPLSSLLEHRELPRLEESLHHPHGEDVHFSVHHDFFFLQQLCGIKQTNKQASKRQTALNALFSVRVNSVCDRSPSIFNWNSSRGRRMTSTNSGRRGEKLRVIVCVMREEDYLSDLSAEHNSPPSPVEDKRTR